MPPSNDGTTAVAAATDATTMTTPATSSSPMPHSLSSENLRRKQLVNRPSNPIITTEEDDDDDGNSNGNVFIDDNFDTSNKTIDGHLRAAAALEGDANASATTAATSNGTVSNTSSNVGTGSTGNAVVVASDELEEDSLHAILKADAAGEFNNEKANPNIANTIDKSGAIASNDNVEMALKLNSIPDTPEADVALIMTAQSSSPSILSKPNPIVKRSQSDIKSQNSPSSYMPSFLMNNNNRHAKSQSTSTLASSFDFDSTIHRRKGNGILASQGDLSASPKQFAAGCTLLQLCAIGNLPSVQSHLANVYDNVNFRDYDRRTALHVAASEGHLEVVRYLVGKGAKVNSSDRWGGSPLDDAHRHRHSEVARFLRVRGGTTGSTDVTTSLIAAAAAGDIEEVKMLLLGNNTDGGAGAGNVGLDLSGSRNSIHKGGMGGGNGGLSGDMNRSRGMVNRLRGYSMDVSEPSALFNANVVDISKGDYDNRTPLHLAAGEGHVDVVELLCKHGANVNAEDRWGGKPLDDALEKRHERVVAILRKYGATETKEENFSATRGKARLSSQIGGNTSETEEDENFRVDFDELEMVERIGSGAFGEIYKCRWRGILVAAKCIKASKIQKEWLLKNRHGMDKSSDRLKTRLEAAAQEAITEEEKQLALDDFRRETGIMRRLRHPNICMMLAYSQTEDVEVMISELMRCSLLDVFKANAISNSQIPKRTQIVYAQQLAQGMNHLHKSRPPIIHRDLKPANLLIDYSGCLKIADFGLAKIRPNPEQCEVEAFMMTGETGSYRFMAPEVFRHEEYTESVDVYSYAMIFYYMLRSTPPWSGLSGVDAATKAAVDGERPLIPRDVDARLSTLLKRCWDENPNGRPSFEEIIKSFSIYSHDVFKTDDKQVTLALQDKGCGCVIS